MNTPRPSHVIVLRTMLLWSAVITGILAAIGALIGYLVAGWDGLWSALVGAVLAALFLGMTAIIILVAGRLQKPGDIGVFFGIVLAGWVVKLIVFVVVLLVLRGQPWIQGQVFFYAVVASVLASLVVDSVVLSKVRVPYVGDVDLPGSSEGAQDGGDRT